MPGRCRKGATGHSKCADRRGNMPDCVDRTRRIRPMKTCQIIVLVGFVCWSLTDPGQRSNAADKEDAADLVIRNGKVLTVDAKFSTAEGLAIRDGVFVRVGSSVEVQKLVGPKTRVIDAEGRTVIPGLIESHVHA